MHTPKIISFSRTRGEPVPQDIQQRCINRIVQCQALVKTTMAYPTVSFDLRGATAGEAYPTKNHIRLNGQLLNENTDDFVQQTVAHEWAHLAAFNLYKHRIRAHGPEWKSVMFKLGLDPARCHTYQTQKARRTRIKTSNRVLYSGTQKTLVQPTGTPVLPPAPMFGLPIDTSIDIRIPGSVPASAVMWSYASKLAAKQRIVLPALLQHNQAMLTQWISNAKQR